MNIKSLILGLLISLSGTASIAQSNNENIVKRLDQMEAPWGGGNMSPSDSFLLEFISNSSKEIGQVASCSPREAQVMWTCTVQIVGNWGEVSKDSSFKMTKEKEQYLKNYFLNSVQSSYEAYKQKKKDNDFSCKEAAEIRRTSTMFSVCLVKEGEE